MTTYKLPHRWDNADAINGPQVVSHGDEPPTIRNINDILDERGARYGDFMTVASFSQQIKSLLCSAEPFLPLDPDMIEALEMISNKLARMLCGDPTYIENWRDIAGYATLVMNRLSQTNGATDSIVHNVTIGCESDYSRGTTKD